MDLMPDDLVERAVRACGRTPAAAARAVLEFNRAVIDSVEPAAVAVKPQIAFYEAFGCEGLRAYAETIGHARARGLLVIGDVKRNDIGSTAAAYAQAHLPGPPASPPAPLPLGEGRVRAAWPAASEFHADAITINALFGSDGVKPFLERARQSGAGLFVLVRTSNPSSAELQDLDCGGEPFYVRVAALVEEWGACDRGASGYSLVGAVAGATFPAALRRLRQAMPHAVLLVPGLGAQGGTVADVTGAFDAQGRGAIVNASRSVIYAFRDGAGGGPWQQAVRRAAESLRCELWQATHGALGTAD
jgi:orotidine-5'-phosphate decarboxylase